MNLNRIDNNNSSSQCTQCTNCRPGAVLGTLGVSSQPPWGECRHHPTFWRRKLRHREVKLLPRSPSWLRVGLGCSSPALMTGEGAPFALTQRPAWSWVGTRDWVTKNSSNNSDICPALTLHQAPSESFTQTNSSNLHTHPMRWRHGPHVTGEETEAQRGWGLGRTELDSSPG